MWAHILSKDSVLLRLQIVRCFVWLLNHYIFVRLNLINQFAGFIPCQFSCNLALRNPVFRWESCKSSVWESVKKCPRMCTEAGTYDWISRVARDWQAAKWCTRVKHAEKLNCHASYSITRQKVQTSHLVSLWLGLVTQSSREAKSPASSILKNWLYAFLSHSTINTSYTHEILKASKENFEREFWERNPREKQDWLIHNLYIVTLQIPQLSPSPLLHHWEVH